MFVWIGGKLPEEFEDYIRSICVPLSQKLGLDISGFSLPQHISLKISFPFAGDETEVLSYLEERLAKERVFYVNPGTPQRQGNILWMPFRRNAPLRHLHSLLDRELLANFGVEQHAFDREFAYHSTLFVGQEPALAQAEELLRQLPLPGQLEIDTILLGMSDTGKSGSFRVVRQIPLTRKTQV